MPPTNRIFIALAAIVACVLCAAGALGLAWFGAGATQGTFGAAAALMLLVLLLALYAAHIVRQQWIHPLQRLAQGAGELARGNLAHPIDATGATAEHGALASHLRDLAGQIEAGQTACTQYEEQAHELRVVLESVHEYAIFVTDTEGDIVNWYTRTAGVFGYHPDEVRGESFARLFHSREDATRFRDDALAAIASHGRYERDAQLVRKDGTEFEGNIVATPLVSRGQHFCCCLVVRDVTPWRNAERHIAQLATRDPLTGLRNRGALMEEIARAISRATRTQGRFALVFIDLDFFKEINDKFGHVAGDMLLTTIASRLTDCVRDIDVVARLGGDEFVVLMTDVADAAAVQPVAERMLESLSAPLNLLGHHAKTSASIGVCLYPEDGTDTATLMKNADIAMYHAKEAQRNNYQFFQPEMSARVQTRLRLQQELRAAVEQQQFELYYQPQVAVDSGRILGVEALLRWRHPVRGVLPPSEFLGMVEEIGLIQTLGAWVIRDACKRIKAWRDDGAGIDYVVVNVSATQLDGGLVDLVRNALAHSGIEPRWLKLEITETLLIEQLEQVIDILCRLRELGVRVAMDDFGTGYSSLSALQQMPLDSLKIDRSFLSVIQDDGENNERAVAIIAAIVAIARELNMSVVAEGVETHTQLAYLRTLKCDAYQGYLHSKPMNEAALLALTAQPRSVMEDAQGRAITLSSKVTVELPAA